MSTSSSKQQLQQQRYGILSRYSYIWNSKDPVPEPGQILNGSSVEDGNSASDSDNNGGKHVRKAKVKKSKYFMGTDSLFTSNDVVLEFAWNHEDGEDNDGERDGPENTVVIDWQQKMLEHKNEVSDSSEDEEEDAEEENGEVGDEGKKRKRRGDDEMGYYDLDDPFIDDDDDYFIEQLIYKPKIDGYFVWQGAVPFEELKPEDVRAQYGLSDGSEVSTMAEVGAENEPQTDNETRRSDAENTNKLPDSQTRNKEKDPSAKRKKIESADGLIRRKKKRKQSITKPVSTAEVQNNSHDNNTNSHTPDIVVNNATDSRPLSAIQQLSQADFINMTQTQEEPTSTLLPSTPGKRPKKPLDPLPDSLNECFERIKVIAAGCEFKKGKFPTVLREPLVEYGNLMIAELGGDWEVLRDKRSKPFWDHLKNILPSNPTTIRKLVEKQIIPPDVLQAEEEARKLQRELAQKAKMDAANSEIAAGPSEIIVEESQLLQFSQSQQYQEREQSINCVTIE